MITLCMVAGFAALLLMVLYGVEARKRRLRMMPWDVLLDGLMPVRTELLTLLGLESREPDLQSSVPSDNLWDELGGWGGISAMIINAERLYALAAHAQSWDDQKAQKAADTMRAEGRKLQRAALAAVYRHLWLDSPSRCALELRCIASAYYEMTESLLELYDCRTGRGYSRLNASIRPYLSASEYTLLN